MVINTQEDLAPIWESILHEIKRGTRDKKHPFRYVALTTSGSSRYVVLRSVEDNLQLLLFTDIRSSKIQQLQKNESAELLFYHPKKRMQIIASGIGHIHHQDDLASSYWTKVNGMAVKSYTSELAPGTPIEDPSLAYQWEEKIDDKYFAVIRLNINSLEFLQLGRPNHLRGRFERKNDWKGTWLVP